MKQKMKIETKKRCSPMRERFVIQIVIMYMMYQEIPVNVICHMSHLHLEGEFE